MSLSIFEPMYIVGPNKRDCRSMRCATDDKRSGWFRKFVNTGKFEEAIEKKSGRRVIIVIHFNWRIIFSCISWELAELLRSAFIILFPRVFLVTQEVYEGHICN